MSNIDEPGRDTEVTIRRAPKIGVFLVLGALLGFVVTLIVVGATQNIDRTNSVQVTGTTVQDVGFWATAGYFLIFGIPAGMVVGALVALVLDAVYRRRAKRLVAERYDVQRPTETVVGEIEGDGSEDDASAGR